MSSTRPLFLSTLLTALLLPISLRAEMPGWFLQPPSRQDALVATATDSAAHPTLSYLLAVLRARNDLANQLGAQIQSQAENVGSSQEKTVLNTVQPQTLISSQVEEMRVAPSGRVYVLLSLPLTPEQAPVPTGRGLGFAAQIETGAPLEAVALAAWSARLDLSLAYRCKIEGLFNHFVESTGKETKTTYRQTVRLNARLLPARLVQYDIHPIDDGFSAQATLRPEWANHLDATAVGSSPLEILFKLYEESTQLDEDPEDYQQTVKFVGPDYAFTQDWIDGAQTWKFYHRPLGNRDRAAVAAWLEGRQHLGK
ncbi:MAG: hypothetical protein GKR89_20505 [Candidatus Latescibacteria bacterium]|nr:hypothetical protein [Candidatus Latescibacterota bacterium]